MANCKKCDKTIYDMEFKMYGDKCRSCYSEDNYLTNKTALVIRIIAVLEILAGFALGLFLANTVGYDFELSIFIEVVIVSVIIASFIFGFAEIIQKLQNIEDNTKK